MKNLLIAIVCILSCSQQVLAEEKVTNQRHKNIVLRTIANACQLDYFYMVEISTTITPEKIDNGVVDYYYQSQFKVFNREDGRHDEEFIIDIDTIYTHAYDHESKEWGIYSVNRVGRCEPLKK